MADWKPGDLAKCVDVRDIRLPLRTGVHRGGKFLIRGMVYPVNALSDVYGSELALDVGAQHGPKLACRFVKVPPLSSKEADMAGVGIGKEVDA